jgi:hypothetical protein
LLIPPANRSKNGLAIRENKLYGIFIEGLSKHPCDSYESIQKLMDKGSSNRTVAATQMNATSSRAHTIIAIEFKQITTFNG